MHPILTNVSGHQILPNDELTDPWIDQDTTLNGGFIHATLTQATEVLELEHIRASITPEEAIIQGR